MIEGQKTRLRPFRLEDAEKMHSLKSDLVGLRAFAGSPFPSNVDSEKEWISHMYPKGITNNVYFAVEEKDTLAFVGYCVARNIDFINRNADFGVIFAKEHRGKGFFREVLELFCDYVFSQLNLHKLYSVVIEDNSVALDGYKKIGFVEEGLIRDHVWQDGKYKNVIFISLYRKDFYKRKS